MSQSFLLSNYLQTKLHKNKQIGQQFWIIIIMCFNLLAKK